MNNGQISEQGTYAELVAQKGDFANFLLEHMNEGDDEDIEVE